MLSMIKSKNNKTIVIRSFFDEINLKIYTQNLINDLIKSNKIFDIHDNDILADMFFVQANIANISHCKRIIKAIENIDIIEQ